MVVIENVSKIYKTASGEVKALDGVSLRISEGEFVVARGPSGSGKSSLLMCAGAMSRPTRGRVEVRGRDIYAMSPGQRALFRAENIGFVFQMFHLVPYLTALENAMLPALARPGARARQEAARLLEQLGMQARLHHKPSQLSAGEKQRVAMARALLNKPRLLLADEPTGNLDPDNAKQIMDYLAEFHKQGTTVVVVTHSDAADRYADRLVMLREGKIESDRPRQTP